MENSQQPSMFSRRRLKSTRAHHQIASGLCFEGAPCRTGPRGHRGVAEGSPWCESGGYAKFAQLLAGKSGVGKCPFLGILNITFKYLLEIYPQYLGDVQLGHLPTPENDDQPWDCTGHGGYLPRLSPHWQCIVEDDRSLTSYGSGS